MIQVETRPGKPLTITTRVTIVCDGHVYAELSRGWPNLDAALVGLRDQTEDFTAKIVSDILKAHTPESFIAVKKARDAAPLPPQ